jgi:hypothetical protein
MALIGRLAILGAAGAAAAWFLKQRRDSGESYVASSAGSAGVSQPVEPEQVGDAAAAGTGTSETVSESSGTEAGSGGSDATRTSDVVVPDTGSDPLVREQEKAAGAEAGSIGGSPETAQAGEDPGREPVDPGMKPVIEASGEEPETLAENDAARGVSREREGSDQPAP